MLRWSCEPVSGAYEVRAEWTVDGQSFYVMGTWAPTEYPLVSTVHEIHKQVASFDHRRYLLQ